MVAPTIAVELVPEFEGLTDPRPVEGTPAYRLDFGAQKDDFKRGDPRYNSSLDVAGVPVYYDATRAGSDPTWPYSLFSKYTVNLVLTNSAPGGIATWDIYNIPKYNVGDAYNASFPMAWGIITLGDPARSQRRQLLVNVGGFYADAGVTAPVFKRVNGNRIQVEFPNATATYNVVLSVPHNVEQPASFAMTPIVVTQDVGVVSGAVAPVDYRATTATAGTPGVFTPTGYSVPATLAAAIALPLVASPTTAWTTGQRIVLGDASLAHWSGTAWVVGAA